MIRFHCERPLSRKKWFLSIRLARRESIFSRSSDRTIKNIKRFSTDFHESFNTVPQLLDAHTPTKSFDANAKARDLHMSASAYGKWIDNNFGLERSKANSFLFSWRQHKKGSSWMDAKSPWNFITKQFGIAEELREDSIHSSFNKLFYVFITPWLPHEKWAGKTHAQEVTRKFFFVCCVGVESISTYACAPKYFAMVDCWKNFALLWSNSQEFYRSFKISQLTEWSML